MGRVIVKLKEDKFVHWSSVVDAPVTHVMSEKDFRAWYEVEFGVRHARFHLDEEMELAKRTGCSSRYTNIDAILEVNRAGVNESHSTKTDILRRYSE